MKIIGEICVLSLIIVMVLYVGSVQHVISLLFASVCCFLITRLVFFNVLSCVFSCFVCLFSILCILCSCIVFVYCFSCCTSLSFSYICTSLRASVTGWKLPIISILPVFVSIDAYICHMSYSFVLVLSRIGNIWVWCLGGIPRSLPFLIQENSSRLTSLNPSNTLLIPILMLTTLFVVQC